MLPRGEMKCKAAGHLGEEMKRQSDRNYQLMGLKGLRRTPPGWMDRLTNMRRM
jgi:hypothetical protein